MTRRLALVALALLASASVPAATQSLPSLFVEPGPSRSLSALDASPPAAVAERTAVGMQLDALFSTGGAQPRVLLNVGGHDWIARFQRVDLDASGFRSWVGGIEGIEHSHVVFTERDGTVSGLINALTVTYRVRTASSGAYFLERMIADGSRGDSEPRIGALTDRQSSADIRSAAQDDASTIDVLMLYTPNARARAGGVSQIQAMAAQVISDTNTIFSRSGIAPRVRLAGTAEFTLVEAQTMGADLNLVTDSPASRTLRDTHHADLVQLLVSSPDMTVCGLGWLLTSLAATDFDAYSVADVDCVPQYSPTHEMAHNVGSHHAPEDGASGALFTYSYGYKDPARGFRTVMASACATASCPRIANFSNPGVFNNGSTTGSVTQNNTLSINNAALTVANWRASASSGGGTGGTTGAWSVSVTASTPAISAAWPPPPNGFVATGYQVEINNAATGQTVAIVNVGTAQSFSTTLANGSYVLRVRAMGSGGAIVTTTDSSFLVGPPATNTPPFAPQDLRAEWLAGRVTLTWNMSAATPAFSSFVIDVGTSPSLSDLGSFDTGSAALRLVTPQPPPGIYFVRVRARNAFGSSPASNEVVVNLLGSSSSCSQPPATPVGLNSTVAGSFVTVAWTYPFTTSPVSGYRLEVGSSPGLSNLLQYPLGPATVFGGVAPPGIYYARVRAVNACGQSGPSNEVMVVVP